MLSDSIAAHLHAALTEAIRDEKVVHWTGLDTVSSSVLVDATGVGRLTIWEVAEIAAEAAEMEQKRNHAFCSWCGYAHPRGQGRFPLSACPEYEE